MARVFEIAAAIMVSIGGAAALLVPLAGWLGRLWAERALAEDREHFRTRSEAEIARIRSELEVVRLRAQQEYVDKAAIYRSVVDLIAPMITALGIASQGVPLTVKQHVDFEIQRLRAYGYAAMFAPQSVMDCFDELIDYLLDAIEDTSRYDFTRVRTLGIALVNAMREDIATDKTPIAYRGSR